MGQGWLLGEETVVAVVGKGGEDEEKRASRERNEQSDVETRKRKGAVESECGRAGTV